ncbi:Ig-like domain-containing protein [Clostridium pasteurianum]|nr:Ig domain-containing protein [Clostridium pasteurianum]
MHNYHKGGFKTKKYFNKFFNIALIIGFLAISLGIKSTVFADSTVPGVTYQGQIQNIGWQSPVTDYLDTNMDNYDIKVGTLGQGLRLESLKVNLVNAPANAAITYSAHVQNIGWQQPVSNGELAGTVGQGLRVEAFKASISNMPGYLIQYRAHVQNIGWQDWVTGGSSIDNSNIAGTVGQGLRIEAIQIRLVKSSVDSITLDKNTCTLFAGQTDTLKANIQPTYAANQSVTWTSSNTSIATVDNTGKVTAISAGTANITATTADGNKTASCAVTVNTPTKVDSISLKPTDALKVGDTDTLAATISPENASEKSVTWTSSNASVATVDSTGKVTAVSAGTANITATTVDGGKTASCNVTVTNNQNDGISVSYQADVKGTGLQNSVSDGQIAGTVGQGLAIHGIKVQLMNAPAGASVEYQTQVQNIGWQPIVSAGTESGSDGQDLNVESVKIYLKGLSGYKIQYQAQVQNVGWMNWVNDGDIAGTVGQGLRLEALKIRIVKDIHVQYSAHFGNIGWKDPVTDGTITGSNAKPFDLQALKVQLINPPSGASVQCQAQVQNIGWMNPVTLDGNNYAGTTGQGLRLEALKLQLLNAPGYSIKYQVDVEGQGWQNWVSNGQMAGTTGLGLRIQGIRIIVYADDGSSTSDTSQPSSSMLNTVNFKASEYLRYSSNIQATNQTAIKLHNGINQNNCVYFSSTALRAVGFWVPYSMCNTGDYTNYLLGKGWNKQTDVSLLTPGSVCFTVNDGLTYPTHTFMFLDWVNPDDHTSAYVADNQSNDVHVRSLVDAPGIDALAYFLHQ